MLGFWGKTKKQLPTLAIDLDGVLHDYHTVRGAGVMGDPIKGAREAMQNLTDQGYTLVIYSVKANTPYGKKMTLDWLETNQIPYNELALQRPAAAIYLDDRGLHFTTWRKALRDIDKRLSLQ